MIEHLTNPPACRTRRTPWHGDALSLAREIDVLLEFRPRIKPALR